MYAQKGLDVYEVRLQLGARGAWSKGQLDIEAEGARLVSGGGAELYGVPAKLPPPTWPLDQVKAEAAGCLAKESHTPAGCSCCTPPCMHSPPLAPPSIPRHATAAPPHPCLHAACMAMRHTTEERIHLGMECGVWSVRRCDIQAHCRPLAPRHSEGHEPVTNHEPKPAPVSRASGADGWATGMYGDGVHTGRWAVGHSLNGRRCSGSAKHLHGTDWPGLWTPPPSLAHNCATKTSSAPVYYCHSASSTARGRGWCQVDNWPPPPCSVRACAPQADRRGRSRGRQAPSLPSQVQCSAVGGS